MKQIREDLHLSQQALALLLNVSRSAISHYENGMRNMPAKAAAKWSSLFQLWQQQREKTIQPGAAADPYRQLRQQQSLQALNAQLQRAAARSVSISQRLTHMEKRHDRLAHKLHFLKNLIKECRPGTRQMDLLKSLEEVTRIQIAECCPEQRQLLTGKLQVLGMQQKAALACRVIIQHPG